MPKGKTMHELAKEFPDKTYRDLEKYREKDRQQEAGACIIGEARKDREQQTPSEKSQDELEPVGDNKPVFYTKEITKLKKEIKELEESLANALAINEFHQKLNGRLQERLTDVEEENKKLHKHVDKQVSGSRKSGM